MRCHAELYGTHPYVYCRTKEFSGVRNRNINSENFTNTPLSSNRKYPIICAVTNEWIVEFTDEFELWWLELSELVQEKCAVVVDLLTREGLNLGFPYSSSIRGSAHALRELRIQCGGHPYRILYAFDPQRNALLILGGDKTGNDRWYEENVPRAERIYEQYLKEIEEESK